MSSASEKSDTKLQEKASISHVESGDSSLAAKVEELEQSQAGNDFEHSLTLRDGLRLYPKAIAWSLLISTAVVMEGRVSFLLLPLLIVPSADCARHSFDLVLITNFFGFPSKRCFRWLLHFGNRLT